MNNFHHTRQAVGLVIHQQVKWDSLHNLEEEAMEVSFSREKAKKHVTSRGQVESTSQVGKIVGKQSHLRMAFCKNQKFAQWYQLQSIFSP